MSGTWEVVKRVVGSYHVEVVRDGMGPIEATVLADELNRTRLGWGETYSARGERCGEMVTEAVEE